MIVVGRDGIVNLECIGRRLEVVTVEILYLGRELKQRCQDTSDVGANDSTLGSMVQFPQPSPWQYEKKKKENICEPLLAYLPLVLLSPNNDKHSATSCSSDRGLGKRCPPLSPHAHSSENPGFSCAKTTSDKLPQHQKRRQKQRRLRRE